MPDNVTLPGTGEVIGARLTSSVKYQRIIIDASTATLTNVNDTASSTSLLASTAGRLGVTVFNDSTSTLYLKYGTTASATSFTVKIPPGAYWEMPLPIYTGAIDGIWSADASGAARITELTV